jgi:hypothetical protein
MTDDYNPVRDASTAAGARLREDAPNGFASPKHDLSAESEAWTESLGKVQGGESGHLSHSGAWMSPRQMRELVDRFAAAGQDRAYVIRCLQGSGYDVSGLK